MQNNIWRKANFSERKSHIDLRAVFVEQKYHQAYFVDAILCVEGIGVGCSEPFFGVFPCGPQLILWEK